MDVLQSPPVAASCARQGVCDGHREVADRRSATASQGGWLAVHDFTPWSALSGGALIGLAASVLLVALGRVAGISGIVSGLLMPVRGDVAWRALFVAGLVIAGLCAGVLSPELVGTSPRSLVTIAGAGLLVGIGTRLGNGCTSGHGVCGLSRLSARSLVATSTFIATGVLTVVAARWLGGGT
jgi:uncharacterized membrane protein YedE/YeeE